MTDIIISRKQAKALGLIFYYTGKTCPKGHITKRYVSTFACCDCLRDADRAGYWRHIEKRREKSRRSANKFRKENPEVIKLRKQKYHREVRTRPVNRLAHRMSTAIRHALRDVKRGRAWETVVGFSLEQLRCHLEAQFVDGMSWGNMGEWHIDHIRPLSSFDYVDDNDPSFKEAWALSNLRPLWAVDNLKKAKRLLYLI